MINFPEPKSFDKSDRATSAGVARNFVRTDIVLGIENCGVSDLTPKAYASSLRANRSDFRSSSSPRRKPGSSIFLDSGFRRNDGNDWRVKGYSQSCKPV